MVFFSLLVFALGALLPPSLVSGRGTGGVHHVSDVLTENGTVKETYDFVGGQYFRKKGTEEMTVSATPVKWYSQCYDHTNCGQQTFQQRYTQNNDYYRQGGPLFVMLGAEGPLDNCDNYGFQMFWYGAAMGAKFLCIEHRFYGESYPTKDTSATSLKIHTSQQSLADYIQIIRWFKQKEGMGNAKVVAFGGSYGGNLAAWIREKYPQDINVAVSSSGPLEAEFDMQRYIQVVSEVIYYINPSCYEALKKIFECISNVAGNRMGCSASVTSRNQLPPALRYCYSVNFDDKSQHDVFFNTIAFLWASNYPASQNTQQCQQLVDSYNSNSNDPIAAYGQFLRATNKNWGCSSRKKRAQMGVMDDRSDGTSWYWQTCNEFGYYQSCDNYYQLFGYNSWGPQVYSRGCQSTWGISDATIKSNVDRTNNDYKGQKSFSGTCTIFVNGDYDPWHKNGIFDESQTTSDNSVVLIHKNEHCGDMFHGGSSENQKGQEDIQKKIQEYLQSSKC